MNRYKILVSELLPNFTVEVRAKDKEGARKALARLLNEKSPSLPRGWKSKPIAAEELWDVKITKMRTLRSRL